MSDKKTKTVVMVCGAGFATSTAGERQVQQIAKELGIKVNTVKRRATEIKTVVSTMKPDFYLLMTPVSFELNAPSVDGVSLISGVDKEKCLDELREHLKK